MDKKFETFYKNIGERIREARTQRGMSQADLAEKAGLSLPVVSLIENGRSDMRLVTFAKIAEALGVSADDILRLSTPASSGSYPAELASLLEGCSANEMDSIMKIIRQLKSTFDDQKKDLLS